ncbi:hypothetical protein [Neisseria sp.]|uniref:hypothetical protein n=1 Tax=Neisseria sp. TaxID=192066 RepID=UPI0035A0F521
MKTLTSNDFGRELAMHELNMVAGGWGKEFNWDEDIDWDRAIETGYATAAGGGIAGGIGGFLGSIYADVLRANIDLD